MQCHSRSNLPAAQLTPNTRQMPAIFVVSNEAVQVQSDTLEASEINAYASDIPRGVKFVIVYHKIFRSRRFFPTATNAITSMV
jgi:hypothetical protein